MSQSPHRKIKRSKSLKTEKELRKALEVEEPQAPPVSVTMIVKNCAVSLRKTLISLHTHFLRGTDELIILDTGSSDTTQAVAREYGARVLTRPDLRQDMDVLVKEWIPDYYKLYQSEDQFADGCLLDFAEARQIVTDAATHDLIFWIDADDELVEEQSGAFRSLIDQAMDKCDSIFLDYDYAFDKDDGRVTTTLKRERIVDRRKYYWKGKCHETLIPRDGTPAQSAGYFKDLKSKIVHSGARSDHQISDVRNYCIIRSEIAADLAAGRQPDVRSTFYLGNACRGLKLHADAIKLYAKTLELSGSRDDRFCASYYIGVIYLQPEIRRPLDALDYAYQCIKIKPEDARGYFLAARSYHLTQQYQFAIQYFQFGRMLGMPQNIVHSFDPEHITSLPVYIAIESAMEMDETQMAFELLTDLEQSRPDHPNTTLIKQKVEAWIAEKKLSDAIKTLTLNHRAPTSLAMTKVAHTLIADLPEIPPSLEERGLGKKEPADPRQHVTYKNEVNEDVTEILSVDQDLVIYCSNTAEMWGPRSNGLGGSERMVIQMVPRLQANFNVTVYCACPSDQRGIDKETGVLWRHFSEFDTARPRGTIIFWRAVAQLELPFPAQRRIVWCHDVQNPDDWTPARCALVDEVWVLSEYHKTTLGSAVGRLGDKIRVTRNGIDPALYEPRKDEVRNPKRVVFCSSPDRGVLSAIDAFQNATKDPEAELHICYGFTKLFLSRASSAQGYGHIPDIARDVNYYDYMKMVYARMDEDTRIKYRGRVGWEEMAELLRTSGVWLYPTRFHEISCISAMEAQAAGCNIVATDHAALKETIAWKSPVTYMLQQVSGKENGIALNRAIEDGYQGDLTGAWAREFYSLDKLVEDWIKKIEAGVCGGEAATSRTRPVLLEK